MGVVAGWRLVARTIIAVAAVAAVVSVTLTIWVYSASLAKGSVDDRRTPYASLVHVMTHD